MNTADFWGKNALALARVVYLVCFAACVRVRGRGGVRGQLRRLARCTRRRNSMPSRPKERTVLAVKSIANQIDAYDERLASKQSKSVQLIIDPRTSTWLGFWDIATSLALVFTAVFTPIEVGFMSTPDNRWADPLFLVNRGVDMIFLLDVILQFCIMVPVKDARMLDGVAWIGTHRKIAYEYLTSAMAYVDFISIGVSAFDMFAPADSAVSKFKGFRAIRVLRLVKLVRIINASKIFKRWEMRLSINYAVLSIMQILGTLLFICHLFACLWGLQASFDPLNKWPGEKEFCSAYNSIEDSCPPGKVCAEDVACSQPTSMYMYSLYWSIATVTSIGYGDVAATASNSEEQLVCTMIMVCGALLFAQLVGSFCGLAASITPDKKEFRFDMSDLNLLMRQENVPLGMRMRLREYLHNSKYLNASRTRTRLLNKLSPQLAGELALHLGKKWLDVEDVWFTKTIFDLNAVEEIEIFADLSMLLRANIFPPGETIPRGCIYIVSQGSALYGGHVKKVCNAFGIDEVFHCAGLKLRFPATATSYLRTYSLQGESLRKVIKDYPKTAKMMRKHEARWIFRRGIVRLAEEIVYGRGEIFHGRKKPVLTRLALSGSTAETGNLLVSAVGKFSATGPNSTGGKTPEPASAHPLEELEPIGAALDNVQLKQTAMELEVRRLASSVQSLSSGMDEVLKLLKLNHYGSMGSMEA